MNKKTNKIQFTIEVGKSSHIGMNRTNNEDAYALIDRRDEDKDLPILAIVADGMGGHKAGEVASKTAVEIITKSFFEIRKKEKIEALIENVLKKANNEILGMARSDQEKSNMGTTVVTAIIEKDNLYVANIGDSRAYCFLNDKLIQITVDHTYATALGLSTQQAQESPVGSKLTRCLGREENLKVDLYGRKLHKGEKILLCSDGLTRHITDNDIKVHLAKTITPQEIINELIELANKRGGRDNITVIIISVIDILGQEIKKEKGEQISLLWWISGILIFLIVLFGLIYLFMQLEIADILFGPP
ncbi:MAG: Stp1/IreP family PP2C-type Ser/Thr phosphatase [Candidatus Coatesbacteria bacterium]|nr:Stp1/IreP family PP2C-type Ser/Thr phosphatase [Candidatus Coatesbacteria bacterium]